MLAAAQENSGTKNKTVFDLSESTETRKSTVWTSFWHPRDFCVPTVYSVTTPRYATVQAYRSRCFFKDKVMPKTTVVVILTFCKRSVSKKYSIHVEIHRVEIKSRPYKKLITRSKVVIFCQNTKINNSIQVHVKSSDVP